MQGVITALGREKLLSLLFPVGVGGVGVAVVLQMIGALKTVFLHMAHSSFQNFLTTLYSGLLSKKVDYLETI